MSAPRGFPPTLLPTAARLSLSSVRIGGRTIPRPAPRSLEARVLVLRQGKDELPKIIDLLTDLKERRDVLISNSWATYPMMKIIGELEASLKKYLPIALGTPDPYVPPYK